MFLGRPGLVGPLGVRAGLDRHGVGIPAVFPALTGAVIRDWLKTKPASIHLDGRRLIVAQNKECFPQSIRKLITSDFICDLEQRTQR